MTDKETALEKAIGAALDQVRAELVRFYTEGDIGTVVVHVGTKQMQVKATPERRRDPVPLETK